MSKLFGQNPITRIKTILEANGGLRGTLLNYYRTDEIKHGRLVGQDKLGNKYYENNGYFYGRNRWVLYANSVGSDEEGSLIPSQWHGWLHYTTDTPPTEGKQVNYPWITEHTENLTGTNRKYMAYPTTKEKVQAWKPKRKSSV